MLDSILPDLRGTEVCSQLQENRSTATIPIVAMSGRDARRLRADFERFAAVKAFLEKPCPRGALVASIRDLLRSGWQRRRAQPPLQHGHLAVLGRPPRHGRPARFFF